MIVDLPESLYLGAMKQCRDYFTSPEEQIEFWSRLGKAVLENQEMEVALIVDLILEQMRFLSDRTMSVRPAAGCDNFLVSAGFFATLILLPECIKEDLLSSLRQLSNNESLDQVLIGELSEYCAHQWRVNCQIFQLGYKRNRKVKSITALSLARRYVGM